MDWNEWKDWADSTIPPMAAGVRRVKEKYRLGDIARQCEATYRTKNHEVKEFAKRFPPTVRGLQMLFDFCDHFLAYHEDPTTDGNGNAMPVQALQSPAALWHYKSGDCKSYTVFIASVLHHMGLKSEMWLVDYGNALEKHIYPNAILRGKRCPLDVVYKKQQGGRFGTEKTSFKMIKKIVNEPGLYTVGAMPKKTVSVNELHEYADSLNRAFPSTTGTDLTTMTKGEFERWQLAERLKAFAEHTTDPALRSVYAQGISALQSATVSGIGALESTDFGKQLSQFIQRTVKDNAPAFANPRMSIPEIAAEPEVSGLFGKIKDAVKKVGGAVAKAFKALANTFHKVDAKKVAPFFLFAYLPPVLLARAGAEVKRRHAAQKKAIKHLASKGNMGTEQQIMESMATGLKSQYGAMPQEILAAASSAKVGVIPPQAIQAAAAIAQNPEARKAIVGVLKGIGKAIVKIFKKKDKSDDEFDQLTSEANYSDLSLLAGSGGATGKGSYDGSGISPNNGGADNGNNGGASSGGNGLMWLGLAAAAAFALKK